MRKFLLLPLAGALLLFVGCTTSDYYDYDYEYEYDYSYLEVSDIELDIDYPTQVTNGETFDITVLITNTADYAQSVTSIDLSRAYLDGIILTGSTPEYDESWDIPSWDFFSYDYNEEIPAGGTYEVVFHFDPFMAGDYQGSLDVCINYEDACLYNSVRTVISE